MRSDNPTTKPNVTYDNIVDVLHTIDATICIEGPSIPNPMETPTKPPLLRLMILYGREDSMQFQNNSQIYDLTDPDNTDKIRNILRNICKYKNAALYYDSELAGHLDSEESWRWLMGRDPAMTERIFCMRTILVYNNICYPIKHVSLPVTHCIRLPKDKNPRDTKNRNEITKARYTYQIDKYDQSSLILTFEDGTKRTAYFPATNPMPKEYVLEGHTWEEAIGIIEGMWRMAIDEYVIIGRDWIRNKEL